MVLTNGSLNGSNAFDYVILMMMQLEFNKLPIICLMSLIGWLPKIKQVKLEPTKWKYFKVMFYNNLVPPDERS